MFPTPKKCGVKLNISNRTDKNRSVKVHTRMASALSSRVEKPAEDFTVETLRQYVCPLTLDPDTASLNVQVSNGDKTASYCQRQNLGSQNKKGRFKELFQVMCREELSGRHFCQVEWFGRFVSIGITYKDSEYLSVLPGYNKNSWAINMGMPSGDVKVLHDGVKTQLSRCSPMNVGVYLDWPAGILSFYDIDDDKAELIHTYHTTFTQPLFLVFCISSGIYLLPQNPGPTCIHYHDPWDVLVGQRDCKGCNGAMAE